MYFHTRAEAGDLLADKLAHFRYENTVVMCLSPGGVAVGEQIARRLHTQLCLLLTAKITAPGDASLVIGTMDHTGLFTYNSMIPPGEMEEYMSEMRNYMEEEKMRHMYEMSAVVGENGMADPAQIEGRNVIIATDGVKNGMSVEAALHFLDKLHCEKIIGAVPVGPGDVVERLEHKMDELYCLYIPAAFFTVSHYYTDERAIGPEGVMDRINNVVTRWI